MTEPFDGRVHRALHERAARIDPPADALGDIHRRARRQRRVRRVSMTLAVVALLGLGAAAALPLATRPDVVLDPGSDSATPAATPKHTPADDRDAAPAGTSTCEGSDRGVTFRIHYPESWWASDGSPAEPCHWFHPEPYDMPSEARDVTGVAIHVSVSDRPFDKARRIDDADHRELLSESETTVDGRRAVVQEYVSHIDTLYPAGTRFYRFAVEVGDRTLSGSTSDATLADYGDSTAALDRIVTDLEVVEVGTPSQEQRVSCSATDLDVSSAPQEGLPDAVAKIRGQIIEAAASCAYERLEVLAGEEFTYSFGGGDDFVGFLRRGEDSAPRPLRYLVELLDRPYGTVEVQGQTQYVWPSAFASDSWDEVPAADREALTPLYHEDDFARFAQLGGYTGYRVGISADGRWLFFVAGD